MTIEVNSQQYLVEALALSAAFKAASALPADDRPRTPPSPSPLYEPHLYNPKSSAPTGLGDLNRLWAFLDKPIDNPPSRRHESIESYSSAWDRSTPPSSLPEDVPDIEGLIGKGKEVRWTDEVDGNNIAEIEPFRRRNKRSSTSAQDRNSKSMLDDSDFDLTPSQSTRSQRRARNKTLPELTNTSEFESEAELRGAKQLSSGRQRVRRGVPQAVEMPNATTNEVCKSELIPSWVTPQRPKSTPTLWVPPSIPELRTDPSVILPLDALTRKEKYAQLVKKLQNVFFHEPNILCMKAEEAAKQYGGNNSPHGVHIFVDCSNIVIGFVNELKSTRKLNVKTYIKGAAISWHALAVILERGRPVARRVLVGSHGSPYHEHQMKRPDYMTEAEKCGYELNVLDRVLKNKDPAPTKKKGGSGNGYATASGYSSGSDGAHMRRAVAEQAVDEILHMKLLESIVDTKEPSTIVLASGDAAEAEYSGGFLKNVERALVKGWKVEIVAWSSGLSKDYQSKEFLKKWKGRVSIITLDKFSEELLALYTNSTKAPKGVPESFTSKI